MAGRKALPNQQKSAVRARLATQQASPPEDLSVIDGRLDALEAAPPDYTSTDFDTDFASKTTTDLTEGTNLYYTTTRANSAIDTRVDKAYVDALNADADTLDSYDSTAFGRLAANHTWTGTQTFTTLVASSNSTTPLGAVKLGRTDTQYVDFSGSASGNFITSVSPGGAPKNDLYLGVSIDAGATHAATWRFRSTDGSITTSGNTFWHSGTFDPADYAALSGAAFTGACTITAATSLPMNFTRTGSSGGLGHRYTNTAGYLDWFAIPTGTDTGSMWSNNALMQIGAGSAALPTYSFSGNPNTGMYRSGTDQVGIAAGGNPAMLFSGTAIYMPASTTESRNIEIGSGRTGNGYAYIDFIGDATYTDYGLRLMRLNSGPNATSQLIHRGTGNLDLGAQDAGQVRLLTNNSARLTIASTGAATFTGSVDTASNFSGNNLLLDSGNGNGLRFWGGSTSYSIYMSAASDATYGGRVAGETTSDYNIYSKITGGTNRGFVFKNGSTAVAGIDGSGNLRATGAITTQGVKAARVNSGTATNSGLISWGTAAPGTLAEGEVYMRYV